MEALFWLLWGMVCGLYALSMYSPDSPLFMLLIAGCIASVANSVIEMKKE